MADLISTSTQSIPLHRTRPATSSLQPLELHHLSHDLRGPLNSILGFSELLLEGIEGPLNEMQSEDVMAIYQSAQNLLLLINNMVDISKIEAGTINFDFGPVDLNQVLDNVARFDFGSNKPASLDLVIHQSEAAPIVWGDASRIEQMILSLIRFAFSIKRTGEIIVTIPTETGSAQIQVIIAGVTLLPVEQNSLFELAVRVDEAGRSDLGKGGLDLPLARRLAECQEGQVWVESDEIGTRLHLQLSFYDEADNSTD